MGEASGRRRVVGKGVEVPEAVRLKALFQGTEGQRWLDGLGCLVRELEQEWGVAVGPVLGGGSESYVAAAVTAGGAEVVVKLEMPPYGSFEGEVKTLLSAEGRGYARLLAHDERRHATLQERLGPSLREVGPPVAAQIKILCATLRSAWEVPAPSGLQTGAEKARWLSGFIAATWEKLDRPCSRSVVERAIAFADKREKTFDPKTAVLVHGDAHSDNALQDPGGASGGPRFKLVDPDGLLAEPAYDLAIPMRDWSGELLAGDTARLARERCARLARLTGVDPGAIWEWGFVERVSTGLLATLVGDHESGAEMLAVAESCAGN